MIFPIPIYTSNRGNTSDKTAIAMLVSANILLLVFFAIMYNLFLNDSYKGTFWGWSWDMNYRFKDVNTNAGKGPFFWIPLFVINGIAFLIALTELVERIIFKKK